MHGSALTLVVLTLASGALLAACMTHDDGSDPLCSCEVYVDTGDTGADTGDTGVDTADTGADTGDTGSGLPHL